MENSNYALISADEKGAILALRGKINCKNSQFVEGGVLSLRAAHPRGKLSIDASLLESISSCGLRSLMRIRQNEGSMKIFNVSDDVYKSLNAKGLGELVEVVKAVSKA